MTLFDLLYKFMNPIPLRIKIDGKYVLDTLSTSSVISFYGNLEIDRLFYDYQNRTFNDSSPYIEVWLKGEEKEK